MDDVAIISDYHRLNMVITNYIIYRLVSVSIFSGQRVLKMTTSLPKYEFANFNFQMRFPLYFGVEYIPKEFPKIQFLTDLYLRSKLTTFYEL